MTRYPWRLTNLHSPHKPESETIDKAEAFQTNFWDLDVRNYPANRSLETNG